MKNSTSNLSPCLDSLISDIDEGKSVKLTLKARDALMLALVMSTPYVAHAGVKSPEHFEFAGRLVRLIRKALSLDAPNYSELIPEAMAEAFLCNLNEPPARGECSGYSQLPAAHKKALVATDIKLKYALQAIADIKSVQPTRIREALGMQIEENAPVDPDQVFDEYIKHLDQAVKEG